jgi:hypothetical protein
MVPAIRHRRKPIHFGMHLVSISIEHVNALLEGRHAEQLSSYMTKEWTSRMELGPEE